MAKRNKPPSKQKSEQKSKTPPVNDGEGVCLIDDDKIPESLKTILEDIPPEKKIKAMALFSQTMSFRSQYPPPDVLREYQQIDPALVQTIISQAEREQVHRHDMDRADVKIRNEELQYKKRGQSIAAWLTPVLIILVGVFVYFTSDTANQAEVLKHYLRFILWIAGLFVTGRLITGIENVVSMKK
jgi:uncharacterized membrane protein